VLVVKYVAVVVVDRIVDCDENSEWETGEGVGEGIIDWDLTSVEVLAADW
jgi:hypothetical protein